MNKNVFMEKSIQVHSLKERTFNYDFISGSDKVEPVITLVCNIHNHTFTQSTRKHLEGQTGCKFCSRRGLTQEDIIFLFKEHWGERWDYSKTVFKTMNSKVVITCRDHGDFEQTPSYHLKGIVSCGKCNGQERITRESFIERAVKVHGVNQFDFSEVGEIKGAHTLVTVRCLVHDVKRDISAWQILKGNVACDLCMKTSRMTLKRLEYKASIVGLVGYDFSLIPFNDPSFNVKVKTKIGCPKDGHGFFLQTIDGFLSGRIGCPECDRANRLTSFDDFIERSLKVWGPDHYDYSHVVLKNGIQGDVSLLCKLHPEVGVIEYPFFNHLQGNEACEKCRKTFVSKPEIELRDFVESLGFSTIVNSRKILNGKEIDIFVPSKNVGIEFNGVYYHSEKFIDKGYHFEKTAVAKDKGIRLLHIWEDDWKLRRAIVENHIKSVLGVSDSRRVFARKLSVRVVDKILARSFMNSYHIQGFVPSTVYLGLFDGEELVAVMSFTRRKNNEWLLSRYATSCQVVGGHSKLLKFFEKTYAWDTIITFADLSYSYGDLYRKTGWIEESLLAPDYWYCKQGERFHKFGYRKSKFEKDPSLKFDEGLTEHELALLNGLYRVYDAGKIRFIRKNTTKG